MKLAPAPLPAQQWRWDGHGQFIWAIHFTITSNKYSNLSFPFLIGVGAWDCTCVTCGEVTRVVMSHKTQSSWHWNSLIQVRLTFASQRAAGSPLPTLSSWPLHCCSCHNSNYCEPSLRHIKELINQTKSHRISQVNHIVMWCENTKNE